MTGDPTVIPFQFPRALPTLEFRPAERVSRADRSELIAALVGSVALLAEIKSPIGSAYRMDLVRRIRSIIEREHRALGVL